MRGFFEISAFAIVAVTCILNSAFDGNFIFYMASILGVALYGVAAIPPTLVPDSGKCPRDEVYINNFITLLLGVLMTLTLPWFRPIGGIVGGMVGLMTLAVIARVLRNPDGEPLPGSPQKPWKNY